MRPTSGREFIRLLERRGWVLVRSRGSHFMYRKEGLPLLVVPVHGNKPLKRDTLQGLMKDAGMTEKDLEDV